MAKRSLLESFKIVLNCKEHPVTATCIDREILKHLRPLPLISKVQLFQMTKQTTDQPTKKINYKKAASCKVHMTLSFSYLSYLCSANLWDPQWCLRGCPAHNCIAWWWTGGAMGQKCRTSQDRHLCAADPWWETPFWAAWLLKKPESFAAFLPTTPPCWLPTC